MTTATESRLTMQDLAKLLELPEYVVRRAVDRYGLTGPRRFRQHRSIPAEALPDLRRKLAAEGYAIR